MRSRSTGDAHKGITSKFTYNADVYPVFLNRCGRCHIDGGVGPMSLLKYEDAFPWAESLRAELLTAYPNTVPEGGSEKVDPHDFVKAAHRQISARELDIVLDWATGGTPEGDKAQDAAPAIADESTGPSGRPDLIAPMPDAVSHERRPLSKRRRSSRCPFSRQTPVTVGRARSPSRQSGHRPQRGAVAAIAGRHEPRARHVGAAPGAAPIALKPPVRIEPGSQIVARIHYKKTWKYEGQPMSDLSSVGLYFAD